MTGLKVIGKEINIGKMYLMLNNHSKADGSLT